MKKVLDFRAPGFVEGWGDLLPGGVGDATPALLVNIINARDISYDAHVKNTVGDYSINMTVMMMMPIVEIDDDNNDNEIFQKVVLIPQYVSSVYIATKINVS